MYMYVKNMTLFQVKYDNLLLNKSINYDIISNDGIFSIINDKIYKKNNIDNKSEMVSYYNIDFIIDNSSIVLVPFYKIPYDYIKIKKEIYEYSHINTPMTLIVVKIDNKTHDIYFKINNNNEIKEDIKYFIII